MNTVGHEGVQGPRHTHMHPCGSQATILHPNNLFISFNGVMRALCVVGGGVF